jgi:hypothetical protein
LVPPSVCISYSKANTLPQKKAKQIAERMQVDKLVASDFWPCQFKDLHGLAYKKISAESATANTSMSDQVTGRIRVTATIHHYTTIQQLYIPAVS